MTQWDHCVKSINSDSLDSLIANFRTLSRSGNDSRLAVIKDKLLLHHSGSTKALNLIAVSEIEQGNLNVALSLLDRSLAIDFEQSLAHLYKSQVFERQKAWKFALESCNLAIDLKPDLAKAYRLRARLLQHLGRLGEAEASFQQAVALEPQNPEGYFAWANLMRELGRLEDAIAHYDKALALKPDLVQALNNRGKVLKDLGHLNDAMVSYERALTVKPDHLSARLNRAHLLMLKGELRPGWLEYEWRWKTGERKQPRRFQQPRWLGEPVDPGCRLFVWHEQGLGDAIQMVRYASRLAAMGFEVVWEAPSALVPLFSSVTVTSLSVVPAGRDALCSFDLHCPLMSLPLAVGTTALTIPETGAYLHANAEKEVNWRGRLGDRQSLRVGIAWSGSPTHRNDANRSIALREFATLLELPFEFHCLQKEVRESELEYFLGTRIIDHRQALRDFSETAALVQQMDLVISVDTSVAHLAGAMGKRLWLLLPFIPDHRWMMDRPDSPWYRTASLFRQPARGNWSDILLLLRDKLARTKQ